MGEARLPVHIEVSGLMRRAEAVGGFATILARGDREAGTIMVVTCHKGRDFRAWERLPQPDGTRSWTCSREEDPADPAAFTTYLDRRRQQDSDLWIVELDIAEGERFIR